MAGLRFKIAELERETIAMKTMGKGFLDPQKLWVLDRFLSNLQSIGGAHKGKHKGKEHSLELECLHTRPSNKYEAGNRRGGKKIHAVISGTWDLRPLAKREIEFCGKASTKIALYDSNNPDTRLAMWRLELGDEKSPGCYVHAHILINSPDPPFLKSSPIPRLPSLFVTPMSAIEFVLGELFQDEWAKATTSNANDTPYWRELQKKRLQKLLSWYQDQMKNLVFSPWIALKQAKPEDGLFL